MALRTTIAVVVLLLFVVISCYAADEPGSAPDECDVSARGSCYDKAKSMRLKIIAIFTILIASMIGVCLPFFTTSIPALGPDRNLFFIVKAFSSGVILATGYMHVLPDSFENLTSPCLPEKPWAKFPFTAFIAMLSAIFTLMIDSLMTAYYTKVTRGGGGGATAVADHESPVNEMVPAAAFGHGHLHGHGQSVGQDLAIGSKDQKAMVLRRNRVIAQVLEMGIIVHSVVIGLSMGASQNPCTIGPLVAALCFHQLFEGMGLGGVILQAEYRIKMKSILAFFFATTTPFGIALGIGLSNVYSDNSPTALIVVGVLNASSAGLLNYTALVDLLAADFMGPKLQNSIKLQLYAYMALLLGAGGMSLMAKWA